MDVAGMSSTDSIISARYSRSSGLQGANVTPQLPITTVVTPCQHDEVPIGSHASWASRWVWMSTNPGVTMRSVASISTGCSLAVQVTDRRHSIAEHADVGPHHRAIRCRRRRNHCARSSRTSSSATPLVPDRVPSPVPRRNDATARQASGVADGIEATGPGADVDPALPDRRGRLDAPADVQLPLHRRLHRRVAHVVGTQHTQAVALDARCRRRSPATATRAPPGGTSIALRPSLGRDRSPGRSSWS